MNEKEKRCEFCKQIYTDWGKHWMEECPYSDGLEWAEMEK